MNSIKTIAALAATLCLAVCFRQADRLVIENTENAKVQLSALLALSEEGDTLRIPSTFKDGAVEFVPEDDWVSGFFAGSLWYMYELSGDEFWADHARRHTEKLDTIQYLKWHHDVGFMISGSYGNGLRIKNTPGYKEVILNAAKSLSTRFRPGAGVLQSWNVDRGWQAERGWECPVIIDNMMNLELLFNATRISGDSTYFNIAVSHADKTLQNHFRPDASCYHVLDYDPQTGEVRQRCTAQGYADESAWARGQAWALYGYAMTYAYTGFGRYLSQAEKIAAYIMGRLPEDGVPYWDFDAPDIPDTFRDASSASIMASAFYHLYSLTRNSLYRKTADKMLVSLSSEAYLARQGTNGGFILKHSVGSLPHGNNIDVPLNYADYYFLEALLKRRRLE
ncbi:MAG: glycoside hydrolase family 88 protein [Bacteroidales bacterium]|nr:glycoside hydrolase family 88 protein [Bacteroidales bacterium]